MAWKPFRPQAITVTLAGDAPRTLPPTLKGVPDDHPCTHPNPWRR
jgi:hypothetical protein